MPNFTPEEKALLAPFVTSTDADIFAVTNLSGIVGAVYARYSRAPGGFRETLLKEFIKEGNIDAAKAQDLIERVLIAYGDDSVGELEGAHVSFENISILSTKEIEDRRIGASPIEQSTRYVFYDQKDADGNYRYYRPADVMASKHGAAYVEAMDFIFSTYCELVEPMKAYYSGLKPMEAAEYDINGDGVKETLAQCVDDKERKAFRMTYNADIRTKACDSLRALLPISTKTNVGLFGNGRFFQNLLSHLYTQKLPEIKDIADRTRDSLDTVIPRYVKRARANEYLQAADAKTQALAVKLFSSIAPSAAKEVDLLGRGQDHIANQLNAGSVTPESIRAALQHEEDSLTLAAMLYPHLSHPIRQVREVVRKLPEETRREIIAAYIGERKTRRDRPGRALEASYPYTFDCTTDFGTYKDLERHRMSTQLRQKFTPMHGFNMPTDIETAGFADKALACVEKAKALYNTLLSDFPEAAAYATLHGSFVRWVMGINDRSLMHLIELRSTPQGHPTYRKVAQLMHKAVTARSAWRGEAMKFADHNDYFWSRGDSEAKQRVKEMALENKGA